MRAEVLVVSWLNGAGKVTGPNGVAHASTDVPATRPAEFITVERVGGSRGDVVESPLLSVQAWSDSRVHAEQLADLVVDSLNEMVSLEQVADVGVQSVINDPDPDSEQPRFQVTVSLTVALF